MKHNEEILSGHMKQMDMMSAEMEKHYKHIRFINRIVFRLSLLSIFGALIPLGFGYYIMYTSQNTLVWALAILVGLTMIVIIPVIIRRIGYGYTRQKQSEWNARWDDYILSQLSYINDMLNDMNNNDWQRFISKWGNDVTKELFRFDDSDDS